MRISLGEFVNARFPIPQMPVGLRGMGEFAPACFPVPQNPIGMAGLDLGLLSDGVGDCGGSCGCRKCSTGMEGLGGVVDDMTASVTGAWDSLTSSVTETLGGDGQMYLMLGGAAVLAYMLLARGGGYRDASKSLREEYRRKAVRLKSEYGRGYQRAGRSLAAARDSF